MEIKIRLPIKVGREKLGLLELKVGYSSDVDYHNTLGLWRKKYGADYRATGLFTCRNGRSYWGEFSFDDVFPLSRETVQALLIKKPEPRGLCPDEGLSPIMLNEICAAIYNGGYVLHPDENRWVSFPTYCQLSMPMFSIYEVCDIYETDIEYSKYCLFNGKRKEVTK